MKSLLRKCEYYSGEDDLLIVQLKMFTNVTNSKRSLDQTVQLFSWFV